MAGWQIAAARAHDPSTRLRFFIAVQAVGSVARLPALTAAINSLERLAPSRP